MKRKSILSVFIVILIFFVTSICVAAPNEKEDSVNANKQSLETSTHGLERAEQRHQMEKEGVLDKQDEDTNNLDDGKKKGKKKTKKDQKAEKGVKDKDGGDGVLSDEGPKSKE